MITLPNGITLDDEHEGAVQLYNYAKRKGLQNIRCFLAIENQYKAYLLVKGQNPIYESESFENVAVRIDILSLNEKAED